MGRVWLAQDLMLDRQVAIKFLSSSNLSAAARERFVLEARALARLHHPNVVGVYRVGDIAGRPYLVSEFVEGTSLDLLAKPMPWLQLLDQSIELARGLLAAHRAGVLHRDIKPANAILTRGGEVKLLDFGLAKLSDAANALDSGPVLFPADADIAGTKPTGPFDWSLHDVVVESMVPVPPEAPPIVEPIQLPAAPRSAAWDSSLPAPRVPTPVPAAPRSAAWDSSMPAPRVPAPSNGLAMAVSRPVLPSAVAALSASQRGKASANGIPQATVSLTQAGAIMGTPLYMAPEVWMGELASIRSDMYAFGALVFEMATGRAMRHAESMNELAFFIENENAPPLASKVPSIDPRFAAIIDRCLLRDPEQRYANVDELRIALERLASQLGAQKELPTGNPYPGMMPFSIAQQRLFFGREAETRDIVKRLQTEQLMVIVGDAGVGKTSLFQAGVIPTMMVGALNRSWQLVTLMPGRRPTLGLANAFSALAGVPAPELEAALLAGDIIILDAARQAILNRLGTGQGLLLVIDPMEELVTMASRPEANPVSMFLAQLAVTGGNAVRIVGALRNDYLTQVAGLPGIGDLVSDSLFVLRALVGDAVKRAIEGPAAATDIVIDVTVIDELVDFANTGGGLAMVQFAIAELWDDRGEQKTITAAALSAIGGVDGAFVRHADNVFFAQTTSQRDQMKDVLLALIGENDELLLQPEEEVTRGNKAAARTLEALIKARLVAVRDSESAATGLARF
jgi:eukaryotic-like serine/threonine-protein kinase